MDGEDSCEQMDRDRRPMRVVVKIACEHLSHRQGVFLFLLAHVSRKQVDRSTNEV